jgi:conjugal transfer ATP-binding protein TraC
VTGVQTCALPICKYSEVAVKGPAGVSIGRLVVDPFAEKLYSTKAEEFQFIRDAEKAGKSLVWAVEELVRRGAQR